MISVISNLCMGSLSALSVTALPAQQREASCAGPELSR